MENLIIEWSKEMSKEELEYKNNGFSKTKGSVFNFSPPSNEDLINSFNVIKNELSVGAIALCKHINRNNIYPEMKGNKESKNKIANDFIVDFLSKEIVWKNIHELNNRIIFELRNEICGIRWYLTEMRSELKSDSTKSEKTKLVFRGLLEPYSTYLEAFIKTI